jgi:hypothetical protein
MKTRVLRGSKQEIAEKVVRIDGEVREAIVFIDEPPDANTNEDVFAEMEPFTVRQPDADDSRGAIYRRMDGE